VTDHEDHVAHFRRRAATYDAIYDRDEWQPQLAVIETALTGAPLRGSCVEFGAGTGWWTQRYVDRVDDVTLVDAAPEMLDLARARLGARASYEVTDVTDWHPTRTWASAVAVNFTEHITTDTLLALFARVTGVVFVAEAWFAGGHAGPRRRSADEFAALLATLGFACDAVTDERVIAVTATKMPN
jgi:SAM-dependent methyltransferase